MLGKEDMETPGAGNVDKKAIINDLVASLAAFDAATPITSFPEDLANKVKSARGLASELKDDLMLLAQELDGIQEDLGKAVDSPAQEEEYSGDEEDPEGSRFASSITATLDRVANDVQGLGLVHLARQIDEVTNAIEALRPQRP